MMKKQILLLTIVVVSSLGTRTAFSQAECWEKKNGMSVARAVMPAVELNNTIYLIGGSTDPYASTSLAEAYDPAKGNWVAKAGLPQQLCMESAGMVNGKIYVIGGSTSILGSGYAVDCAYEYNAGSNTWTRKSNIPTPLMAAASAVVNGKIYIIGGGPFGFGPPYKSVYEYDPATDTWKKKSDMPTARFLASATAVNGKIYVFGGCTSMTGMCLSSVEVYDPSADTWAVKGSMRVPTGVQSSSAVDGSIFIFGGGDRMGSAYNYVQMYNPALDTWIMRTPMPTPRIALATCTVGGKVYVFGGMDIANNRLTTVEEYDPTLDVVSAVASDQAGLPLKYSLHQNYPNPLNPSTMIRYDLPKTADVSLKIYNTLGQVVVTLVEELKEPGSYQVRWTANVPSGIYFYRLQAGEYVETKKMILLK